MGKFLLSIVVIALILFGAWLLFFAGENDDDVDVVNEANRVTLYYYDPAQDRDATGNIQCSREGLVAVEREITADDLDERIEQTIDLLLRGELSEAERTAGITTEFPLGGFNLTDASLADDGTLTLAFNDPQQASSGGSCRAGILWAQIDVTASQFDKVNDVRFQPETLFQP